MKEAFLTIKPEHRYINNCYNLCLVLIFHPVAFNHFYCPEDLRRSAKLHLEWLMDGIFSTKAFFRCGTVHRKPFEIEEDCGSQHSIMVL